MSTTVSRRGPTEREFAEASLFMLPWAEHDGRKGNGPLRACTAAPEEDDDGEAERCRQAERRAVLLEACAGCENTLDLLLKVTAGNGSYWDVARELRMNCGQLWRAVQGYLRRLRNTITLAETAYSSIGRGQSGFTLSSTGIFVEAADVWAVSMGGLGVHFPTSPNVIEVTRYVANRYSTLFGRTASYLGGWRDEDTGEYWLDVSRLIQQKAQAIAFARRHNQKAITHLASLTTILVERKDHQKRRRAA